MQPKRKEEAKAGDEHTSQYKESDWATILMG